jgi:predicted XRE-type DNA-binding protein
MIQNFEHISFYKDIQMYVSENYFDEEESLKVKSKHVQEINRIIADNKISQMQMDTDLLEKVRDDTADFLRMLHQEQEMDECVKRTFTLDLNKSCGDAESNIKVRVQRPRSNLKTGLDEAGHALMAHAH